MKNTGKTSTSNTSASSAYSNSRTGIRRRRAGINGPDLAGWVVP